jgi:hypothetical protein
MLESLSSITASLTAPLDIPTEPASMLWLLPLTAAVCIVYKATKLRDIKAVQLARESVILFGSIIAFMAVVAACLFAFAWLFTE